MTPKNTCLIMIDGWGISQNKDPRGNAILNANTPVMDLLEKTQPFIEISAHGLDVGLPDGLMGNSEVGHLNSGAGRVVYQDIVRIDLAVQKDTIGKEEAVVKTFEHAKNNSGRIHLLGLVSDGGVHSHINHLFKLLDSAKRSGVPEAYVHFFADGRDTSPRSAVLYMKQLLEYMESIKYGKIADIMGRYYAMDRDKRWERIKIAYEGLVQGLGEESSDPIAAIESRYAKEETDEFLKPIIISKEGKINDGDTLLFFNYRSDRMREITQVFGIPPLPFETNVSPKDLSITTMTCYKGDFPFSVIFPPQTMSNTLAEWLSLNNIPQCHIAETEKYAHVTFFFNGGSEAQYKFEDRDLIPSPKVSTYDLKPEMSAIEVANKVAERVIAKEHPFVMCNFAPPDMVGHTGKYNEAVLAIEATDKAIGIIYEACKKAGTVLFVTSDHGNAEKMLSDDFTTPHTAHTCGKVPFIMTSDEYRFIDGVEGALCDIAPTILKVMNLEIPKEMTGRSLLKE